MSTIQRVGVQRYRGQRVSLFAVIWQGEVFMCFGGNDVKFDRAYSINDIERFGRAACHMLLHGPEPTVLYEAGVHSGDDIKIREAADQIETSCFEEQIESVVVPAREIWRAGSGWQAWTE